MEFSGHFLYLDTEDCGGYLMIRPNTENGFSFDLSHKIHNEIKDEFTLEDYGDDWKRLVSNKTYRITIEEIE